MRLTTLKRALAALSALQGAGAVIAGAFAAHGAEPEAGALLSTAAGWQTIAALAALYAVWRNGVAAAMCFASGGLVFAGSLYALAAGAPDAMGYATPVGGVLIILGWLALTVREWRDISRRS